MIKDLVNAFDFSDCAESALVLFVASFAIIVFGALRLSKQASARYAAIPLSDNVEDPRDGK
jgi:cytochrome c oxidase cbb3-type subunit IV